MSSTCGCILSRTEHVASSISSGVQAINPLRYVAEVVVLVTTLGAKRVEYNAGKRARDSQGLPSRKGEGSLEASWMR